VSVVMILRPKEKVLNEQLLTQLAAFSLVMGIFRLLPVSSSSGRKTSAPIPLYLESGLVSALAASFLYVNNRAPLWIRGSSLLISVTKYSVEFKGIAG
jgi:hypothetical protein